MTDELVKYTCRNCGKDLTCEKEEACADERERPLHATDYAVIVTCHNPDIHEDPVENEFDCDGGRARR